MNVPLTYFEKGYPVYYFRGYQFTGIDPKTERTVVVLAPATTSGGKDS